MSLPEIQKSIKDGELVEPKRFLNLFERGLDFPQVLKLRRLWELNRPNLDNGRAATKVLRVAITGSGTLEFLSDCIGDGLAFSELKAELYTSAYNNYVQDLMDPGSELHEFKPDYLIFVVDSTVIWDLSSEQLAEGQGDVNESIGFISDLLKPFAQRNCNVLITNAIHEPTESPGSIRRKYKKSTWNITQEWNSKLDAASAGWLNVVDVSFLAMSYGLSNAFQFKQWFESKLPYALNFHPLVASLITTELVNTKVADKKVLVLDCDNTIWGGVVGDDGIEKIEIGTISARAQAFQGLQKFIKRLKNIGFLLTVASKNEEDLVRQVFREHPEMILREDDIVSFKVNWHSKADNIAEMAEDLNLGLDSFVFLDDNPAEISIVNQFLPEVETILGSQDPVETLEKMHHSKVLFRTSISEDDLGKTQQYLAETKRKSLAAGVTNYDDYLSSLAMSAEISHISETSASRASQLINKSNQFNLTTIRRSESEVLGLIDEPNWSCYVVRLSDKFGDHGIISVLLTEISSQTLHIETFVMSCRVLKRGVESLIINFLAEEANRKGLAKLTASYRATAKNKIVESLYEQLGFKIVSEKNDQKDYELLLNEYEPVHCHIKIDDNP